MHISANKTHNSKIKLVTNVASKKQSAFDASSQFTDNRLEAITQRKLQTMVDRHAEKQPIQRKENINDDAGLEKEADVMGAKALSTTSKQHSTIKNSTLTNTPIQLKMGFEFESGKNKVEGAQRKFLVYENDNYSLESDTKEDVEFVVKPFTKKSEVLAAVGDAAGMARHIAENKNANHKYHFVQGGNVKNKATIKVVDDTFKASAQSTEGVRLQDIGGMITEHIGGTKATWSKDDADEVLKENNLNLSAELEGKINGLIQYIALYVRQVMSRNDGALNSDDGPKAYFRLMARTDFNSMFLSIIGELGRYPRQQQTKAAEIRNLVRAKLPEEIGIELNDHVFASGSYKEAGDDPMRNRNRGPLLGNWINSIFATAATKDLMSPPPGYAAHAGLRAEDRYGMGAYGMDDDKVLVEMRGHRSKLKGTGSFNENQGKIPRTQWRPFAEHIFDLAQARNPTLDAD